MEKAEGARLRSKRAGMRDSVTDTVIYLGCEAIRGVESTSKAFVSEYADPRDCEREWWDYLLIR